MHARILTPSLIATGCALALNALAAEDCGRTVVHAYSQSCLSVAPGLNLCVPVALMGPPAACRDVSSPPLKVMPAGCPFPQLAQGLLPGLPPTRWPAYTPPSLQWPSLQWTPEQIAQCQLPRYPAHALAAPQWPYIAMPAPAPLPRLAMTPVPGPASTPAAAVPGATEAPSALPAPVTPPPVPQAVDDTVHQPATEAVPAPVAVATPPTTPEPAPAPVSGQPQAQAAEAPTPAPVEAPTSQAVEAPTPQAVGVPVPQEVTSELPLAGVPDMKAYFEFDSAELTAVGRQTLEEWLAQAPVGMPVLITGHADRLGREAYNLELSIRRAKAARDYLVAKGKDARDIRIQGLGISDPVKYCKGRNNPITRECLAPNRRVEITPE